MTVPLNASQVAMQSRILNPCVSRLLETLEKANEIFDRRRAAMLLGLIYAGLRRPATGSAPMPNPLLATKYLKHAAKLGSEEAIQYLLLAYSTTKGGAIRPDKEAWMSICREVILDTEHPFRDWLALRFGASLCHLLDVSQLQIDIPKDLLKGRAYLDLACKSTDREIQIQAREYLLKIGLQARSENLASETAAV